MQIKYRRSMGTKGMLSSTVYVLDALLLPSPEEAELLQRFGRTGERIWTYADEEIRDVTDEHYKQLSGLTFQQLISGHRFQYKNFNDVLRSERIIKDACQSVLATCETLATFNDSERVLEVTSEGHEFLAEG